MRGGKGREEEGEEREGGRAGAPGRGFRALPVCHHLISQGKTGLW